MSFIHAIGVGIVLCMHGCAPNAYIISVEGRDSRPIEEPLMTRLEDEARRLGFKSCVTRTHDVSGRLVSVCSKELPGDVDPRHGLRIDISWSSKELDGEGPGWMVEIRDYSSATNPEQIQEMKILGKRFESILGEFLGSENARVLYERPYIRWSG